MAEHVRNLETSAGGAFSLSSGTEKVIEITFDAVSTLSAGQSIRQGIPTETPESISR
jgi:hypothetical protein